MLEPLEFFLAVAIILLVLLVLRIQQKRESANALAKKFCSQHGLQFLDGTVAFRGIHLARPGYQPVFRFAFSYSLARTDRFRGTISLVGNTVQHIHIPPEHIDRDEV